MLTNENLNKMLFTRLVNLPVPFWFFGADYLIVNRCFFKTRENSSSYWDCQTIEFLKYGGMYEGS